jgi:tRNA nucleotidyltransferase (CCA-adding enzyme)
MSLEASVLERIRPTPEEEGKLAADSERLREAAQARLQELGIAGEATVQGSVAKGTWLRGAADIDLFLLLDLSVPEARLEAIAEGVARGVLKDTHKLYAQHPYLAGTFAGRTVDLVPAYRVDAATAKMSAVDRTPFHTRWVRQNLDHAGRDEVRLLKKWLKGTGTYGAQTAVGGFSGYLAEVLVARFKSFHGVVAWLEKDAKPRRIALGEDLVEDDVSPLVVVDPVDAARNCAAAVQAETLQQAVRAARAYTQSPSQAFFFPEPPRAETPQTLAKALQDQDWVAVVLRPRTDRLDIVFPQFQKGARAIAAALEQGGFPVRRVECLAAEDGGEVLMQWLTDAVRLPEAHTHRGPPDGPTPNAERFRSKWAGHPDAAGPVRAEEGRLVVEVKTPARTALEWFHLRLRQANVGKHVAQAMPDAVIVDDVARIPADWAAAASEFILGRMPWER